MRTRSRRPLALSVPLVIILGIATPSASAQSLTGPAANTLGAQPGTRVRVVQSGSVTDAQTGMVVAVGQDAMSIRRDAPNDSLTIAFAQLDRLDLSRGRHGHALIGLGIGLVGGAVVGAVLGASEAHSAPFADKSGGDAVIGAVVLAPVGLLVGTVVGALIRTERWHTVWMRSVADHAHASLDMTPSPTGSRLGLRIAARL